MGSINYFLFMINVQTSRMSMMCYLCDQSSSRFQPIICNSKTMAPISTKSLMSSYTVPYITYLKEIALAVPEIRVPKTRRIFFVFFFFPPNNKSVRKLCSCAPISTKFGAHVTLSKPYISTKFGMICSKK